MNRRFPKLSQYYGWKKQKEKASEKLKKTGDKK
jgi:hypothetical protein